MKIIISLSEYTLISGYAKRQIIAAAFAEYLRQLELDAREEKDTGIFKQEFPNRASVQIWEGSDNG